MKIFACIAALLLWLSLALQGLLLVFGYGEIDRAVGLLCIYAAVMVKVEV